MELNTPEERIAAAIWPPDNPDFRDVCNRIRLYVDLELERKGLKILCALGTDKALAEGRALYLRDLIRKAQKEVDELNTRIRLMEQKNVRPIRP